MQEHFLNRVKQFSHLEYDLIEKAYHFAENAHKGQKRIGGEDFFSHPVNVSRLLLENKEITCDTAMICAALLHDTIEDTKVVMEDIQENFTPEISVLVDALTKIEHSEDVQINRSLTHEKIMHHGQNDRRVFLIKLADVLHNLQTLDVMRKEWKERISKEALFFYVPIAQKMGLHTFEFEIQRLSKKHLEN